MGRTESPIDPATGSLAAFADGLRALRRAAGSPPYRQLARKAHYSPSTLSVAARGQVLPSLPVTLAYVRACGGDVDEWRRRWYELEEALTATRPDAWPPGLEPSVAGPAHGICPDTVRLIDTASEPGWPAPAEPDTRPDAVPAGRDLLPPAAAARRILVSAFAGPPTEPGQSVPPATLGSRVWPPSRHEAPTEPVPVTEEPAPRPEKPAPRSARSVPAHEKPASRSGQPAPAARPEKPASRSARSVPAAAHEEPAHRSVRSATGKPSRSAEPSRPDAAEPVRHRPRHRAPRRRRRTVLVAGIGLVVVFASMEAALAAHHKATRHSPLVIDPVRRTPTPTPSAPGVTATMMTGPGCPVAGGAWSAAQSRADGWITVGGGTPQCGGQALATYTTTSTTSAQDTYSWWFRTARTATCALRIFVPNAAPSSAAAHYEVFAAESRLGGFDIVQARHKGEWVDAGTWKVTGGLLQAQLTDRADYAGAHHHVTAAAASLACR